MTDKDKEIARAMARDVAREERLPLVAPNDWTPTESHSVGATAIVNGVPMLCTAEGVVTPSPDLARECIDEVRDDILRDLADDTDADREEIARDTSLAPQTLLPGAEYRWARK